MKPTLAIPWLAATVAGLYLVQAQAQERIYRCGNEYTNNAEVAKSRGCTLLDGGNITIVQGTNLQRSSETRTPNTTTPQRSVAPTAPTRATERIDPAAQRARDSDARAILDAELRKAEDRLAQVQKEYANGAPEKQGIESRNHQRYLDRVAELKAATTRAQSDVDGIRRELARLGGAANSASSTAK
ncbi:MAG: hypothetical protein U1D25_13905 [Hydrogenophaga sp.]|uniref:hypothetical protein n=1 Tax=Hydrogenophaga sp. TaxID=1904254 RepID=UPI00274EF044|nr:hypothetical protein [Hydrogenophaga sp.]MDP2415919.1 hypothetical protein [Hydrogenophaga sp.]MDZ4189182.1 hypothetical protein [Hydrogenophaga sp.]